MSILSELSIPWSCYEMLQWCVSDGSDNTSNENTVVNDVHGVISVYETNE